MTTTLKFITHIENEIEKINFLNIYNEIDEKEIYDPSYLIYIIQIVLYHLEIIKKINPEIMNMLGYFLSVFRGEHETRKTLSKLELLYLINKMDVLINGKKSCDNISSLYI